MQLEVSAAFMQVKVFAANKWVTIFIEIMQVEVSDAIMQEKSHPLFPSTPPAIIWGPVKPPVFENLVGGSTPPPPQKGGGARYGSILIITIILILLIFSESFIKSLSNLSLKFLIKWFLIKKQCVYQTYDMKYLNAAGK